MSPPAAEQREGGRGGGAQLTAGVEVGADLGGDREAWGHVQAVAGHLAEVRALASQLESKARDSARR